MCNIHQETRPTLELWQGAVYFISAFDRGFLSSIVRAVVVHTLLLLLAHAQRRWIEAEREEALLGKRGAVDGNGRVAHKAEAFMAFGQGPRVCPGQVRSVVFANTGYVLAGVLRSVEAWALEEKYSG